MASIASQNRLQVAVAAPSAPPDGSGTKLQTYGQILKSSVLIGGSSVVNIGLGIIRTKAMALLLGPSGVGLLGLYGSIADLARSVTGMGINSSGVRQIAEAVGTQDHQRVARTVVTLRRMALVLGCLGAVTLAALCWPVSKVSFGDYAHAASVALLGLVVCFTTVSAGQIALVQGMRRIGDLAKANVMGGVYGTLSSVLIVYLFRKDGVVPALVSVAIMTAFGSCWYSRRVKVERVALRFSDMSGEVSLLLKLGFVFMASGLMSMGVAYVVRIMVLRQLGEDAAGFYQSAWALGGLYVGFILQAMGADFFPRLTSVADKHDECNRLVNEQAEVNLLMAGPGVIGTLTFAPLVMTLFYSSKFAPAVEILRWICLGMFLRVGSWPMGFILLAKGARQVFFWSELASNGLQVVLVWGCLHFFGLTGTGIAFFGGYLFYWFLIYGIVRKVSGFRWSAANKGIGVLYGLLTVATFAGWYVLPRPLLFAFGSLTTIITCIYSLKRLCGLIPFEKLPGPIQKILSTVRLAEGPESKVS